MQNGVEQVRTIEPIKIIKYSSPTDVSYLSVMVESNFTNNKMIYNNCTALKVINSSSKGTQSLDSNLICFATFMGLTKEKIDNEIIRNEIGKLLGINMPSVCRISTADRKQNGLIVDTNLGNGVDLNAASVSFASRRSYFLRLNQENAKSMVDYVTYFPAQKDLENPQTTFAMLLKGASSLPYRGISTREDQQEFIEEYYDMIVLDLLTGQKRRNGEDYYYYTEKINTPEGVVTKGHVVPGLLNYSFDSEEKDDTYYLNDFPVNIDVLMDKLFESSYPFIQRVVDGLISALVDYKDCISRIIYNNTDIENAKKIEEMIFHNIDRFVAKAHGTKKIAERLSKIEKISTTTKIHLESVNRILNFQQRYPTTKQEIVDNALKITKLKENENGDYEANIEEGIKLTLSKDEQLEATGYTSSGLLSALIAFVCGLGFGLAYIISHWK